jgi:hypothetical protein
MSFFSTANKPAHLASKWCKRGAVRKPKRELECDYLQGREVQISVSGNIVESVDCFRYLGRPLVLTGSDWPAVVYNLNKACDHWARVRKVLSRQGAIPEIS